MKKTAIKLITLMFITSLTLSSYLLVINGSGADLEIKPLYGQAPVIDGEIDTSKNEWNEAVKTQLNLYQNESAPENPLLIHLWAMQNGSNLYISIQFSFLHNNFEFVGFLISNNQSENPEDFKDAKIVRFSNISINEYTYKDYYLNNSIYEEDTNSNGSGAGKIEGEDVIYEFVLPVEYNESDPEDVFLEYGIDEASGHAFKIIMGDTTNPPSYPEDIRISNNVLIKFTYNPLPPELTPQELLVLTFSIIIFGTSGILYIFYIYRIVKLKEKIERIRI
ncbi:MAG: hypothetical protein ACFE8M_00440 [Candidatus Hermodarchaeota archaeon]